MASVNNGSDATVQGVTTLHFSVMNDCARPLNMSHMYHVSTSRPSRPSILLLPCSLTGPGGWAIGGIPGDGGLLVARVDAQHRLGLRRRRRQPRSARLAPRVQQWRRRERIRAVPDRVQPQGLAQLCRADRFRAQVRAPSAGGVERLGFWLIGGIVFWRRGTPLAKAR